MQARLESAIAGIREEFVVECADSPTVLKEAYQLRHRVYCLDRGFENASGDIETDAYDHRARHVVVRHRACGHAAGTVRLVSPSEEAVDDILPLQRVCPSLTLTRTALRESAEISRFALCSTHRAMSPASNGLLRLALMRGVALLAHRHRVTRLCALIEPTMHRLLQASGIHFHPVGSAVEYHGIRIPVACRVNELLGRQRLEQPAIWAFITDNGRLTSHCDELGLAPQV